MKNGFVKSIIFAVCAALVLSITSGCQEQTTTTQKGTMTMADKGAKSVVVKTKQTSDKLAKTTAAENIELKKQLAAKDKEIGKLKAALDKCQDERDAAKIDFNKNLDAMGEEAMKTFDEYIQLQEEVQKLQKQIEELKAGNKPN